MRIISFLLGLIGAVGVLIGVVWIGQGSGYFPYPSYSFMINQTVWIYWGVVVAAIGAGLFVVSRRLS